MIWLRTFEGMLPMQLGIHRETQLFVLSCFAGIVLGTVYRLLWVVRGVIPHKAAIRFAFDMLFGMLAGAVLFLLCTGFEVKMRLFVFAGMAVSAGIAYLLAGHPAKGLLKCTKWLMHRVWALLLKVNGKRRRDLYKNTKIE